MLQANTFHHNCSRCMKLANFFLWGFFVLLWLFYSTLHTHGSGQKYFFLWNMGLPPSIRHLHHVDRVLLYWNQERPDPKMFSNIVFYVFKNQVSEENQSVMYLVYDHSMLWPNKCFIIYICHAHASIVVVIF